MGTVQEVVDTVQQAGPIPLIVFIVVTLIVLRLFQRVYPALFIGVASALLVFVAQTPGATA